MWQLVLSKDGAFDAFTYDYVFNQMTPQEIDKAIIAVEMMAKQIKKQTGRGRRRYNG